MYIVYCLYNCNDWYAYLRQYYYSKYGKPESQHKVVFFLLVYNVLRKSKQ